MEESDDEAINRNIRFYQKCIENFQGRADCQFHLLNCIQELDNLPIQVLHLKATSVGKTMNALRNFGGEIRKTATAVVRKWIATVEKQRELHKLQSNPIQKTASETTAEVVGAPEDVPVNSTLGNGEKPSDKDVEIIEDPVEVILIEEPSPPVEETRKKTNAEAELEEGEIAEDSEEEKEKDTLKKHSKPKLHKRHIQESSGPIDRFHWKRPRTDDERSPEKSHRKSIDESRNRKRSVAEKTYSKGTNNFSTNHGLVCCVDEAKVELKLRAELQLPKSIDKHFECFKDRDLYPCKKCSYVGPDKQSLNQHQKAKHCSESSAKMDQIELLRCTSIVYQCNQCSYKGPDTVSLEQHQKAKHCGEKSLNNEPSQYRRRFQCDKCEYRGNDRESRDQHQRAKHCSYKRNRIELVECVQCEYKTERKSHFAKHVPYKHGIPDKWYECKKCDYKGKSASHLNIHFHMTHAQKSGDNRKEWYYCDACDFRCVSEDYLHAHQKQKHSRTNSKRR